MLDTQCTVLLIPHVESEPRATWQGDHDVRPLRQLGRERAAELARTIGAVVAVYSSPSLRCVQTVEPLAAASGVRVVRHEGLREASATEHHAEWTWWLDDRMRSGVGGAAVAGRMLSALQAMTAAHRGGRIAVCSHGDSIPLAVACISSGMGVSLPPPTDFGGFYRIASKSVETIGPQLKRQA
jgi:broad specificity phosphatase PhoE